MIVAVLVVVVLFALILLFEDPGNNNSPQSRTILQWAKGHSRATDSSNGGLKSLKPLVAFSRLNVPTPSLVTLFPRYPDLIHF